MEFAKFNCKNEECKFISSEDEYMKHQGKCVYNLNKKVCPHGCGKEFTMSVMKNHKCMSEMTRCMRCNQSDTFEKNQKHPCYIQKLIKNNLFSFASTTMHVEYESEILDYTFNPSKKL